MEYLSLWSEHLSIDCSLRFPDTICMMNKQTALVTLQAKLRSDVRWAQRGLLAIFRNQTSDEQVSADVKHHNAMGFSCRESFGATLVDGAELAVLKYNYLNVKTELSTVSKCWLAAQ